MWLGIIKELKLVTVAEVGVYRGEFAESLLHYASGIEKYYMIDSWRHLDDWNKPWNKADAEFVEIKDEALRRTDFAAARRIVLEGKTTEVADRIPPESLEFAYIDGDHTLRGITVDLIRMWPKMKSPAILGGDDFGRYAWGHGRQFEPTLVFPLAVHFAEAVGAVIYGLPFKQFAIVVERSSSKFEFRDLTNAYRSTGLLHALRGRGGVGEISRKIVRKIKELRSGAT